MNDHDLFSKVKITDNGTICLGKSLICDGFENGYCAAAFTHVHYDHIASGFERCMHQYNIYTSKITAEMLGAITGDTYARRTQFHQIDYDSPQMIKCNGGDLLTLKESKHMFGASQVLLTTHDRIRIVYSGDLSPEDCPPKCDILVIDSTRGSPKFDRILDGESLERRFVDAVIESIDRGKPVCVHAHRGKLQYIMHLISQANGIVSTVPLLSSRVDCVLARIYEKYGFAMRKLIDLLSYEAEEVVYNCYPWIEFRSNWAVTPQEKRGKVRRMVIGGGFGKAVMTDNDSHLWMASDEHAEFTDMLKYIKVADPQVVVTDNSRTPNGKILAEKIKSELGIASRVMPTNFHTLVSNYASF